MSADIDTGLMQVLITKIAVPHTEMNAGLFMPDRDRMTEILSATLRELHGAGVRLEDWSVQLLRRTQTRCVVLFDLVVWVSSAARPGRLRWVGKFYDQKPVAERVVRVLRALAGTDCTMRGNMGLPPVIAFHAPLNLVLLQYSEGEPVLDVLAREHTRILSAMGRALGALHTTGISVETVTTPAALLAELRGCVAELCKRFPAEAQSFRAAFAALARQVPPAAAAPGFLHGDFGPGQLLWRRGRLVVLDFDRCTCGDPAFDLGNLLAQMQRIALREPAKVPDFVRGRRVLIDAYQRWAGTDPDLRARVTWYQRTVLLRKVRYLAHHEAADRLADAGLLLREFPAVMGL